LIDFAIVSGLAGAEVTLRLGKQKCPGFLRKKSGHPM